MIRSSGLRWCLSLAVAAACIFLLLPTLVVVPVSFSNTDFITFPPQGFSLRWYAVFFGQESWRNAMLTSFVVATASAALATVVGTLAALGLNRLSGARAKLVIWLFLLPMVVPSIIVAVALYGAFAPLGLIGNRSGLVVAHTILTLPFVVINVSAILQKLDRRIVNAARSLGAGPVTAFRKVMLPAILPGVLAGAVFAFLTSFDEVVLALFITGPDSITLPVQMWNGIRFEISPAVAAASTILLGVAVLLLLVFTLLRVGAERPGRAGAAS